jgi:putative ABC transport system permease protein
VTSTFVLLKLAFLTLWRQKGVFFLTLGGVAAGTAVVSAVLIANRASFESFQNAVSHVQGQTSYTVRSPSGTLFSDRVLDRLRGRVPSLPFRISPLLTRNVRYQDRVFWVRGVDFLASSDRVSTHPSFEGLTKGGAYLPPGGLKRFGITAGHTVTVLYGTKLVSFPVLGEVPRTVSSSLIPSNTFFMDIAWVQMRFGVPERLSRIDLSWKGPDPGIREAAYWKSEVERTAGAGLSVVSRQDRKKEFSRLLFSYRSNLFALSLVSLIVGMFLIYNTLSLLTLQNRRPFSTFRLIGATPGDIRAIVLMEGLLIGVLGGLAGLVFGHLLSRLTIQAVSRTLDTMYLPVGLLPTAGSMRHDLPVWLLTVGASVFSAYFPAREAMSVPPVLSQDRTTLERSRSHRTFLNFALGITSFLAGIWLLTLPPYRGFPLFGYLAALLWVFSAALSVPLVVRALSRILGYALSRLGGPFPLFELALSYFRFGISRSGIAISSVMIGLAMMTGIVILVHSFERTLDLWITQNLVADLFVKPLSCRAAICNDPLDPEITEAIRSQPDVAFVARYASFPARYKGSLIRIGFSELDRLPEKAPLSLITRHRNQVLKAFSRNEGVLISESFAYHSGKGPGDRVTLPTPYGPRTLRILCVYHDYSSEGGVVLFPYRDLGPLFGSSKVTNLSIFLKPGRTPDRVMDTLLNGLPGHPRLKIRSQPELRVRVMKIFHQSFAITYSLLGISLIISVIGVGNTLLMLLYERGYEFSLMRALGLAASDIRTILTMEAAMMATAGILMGLVLGTGVGWIIVDVINRQAFGWTILWVWPAGTIAWMAFLILSVATVSGALPFVVFRRNRNLAGRE